MAESLKGKAPGRMPSMHQVGDPSRVTAFLCTECGSRAHVTPIQFNTGAVRNVVSSAIETIIEKRSATESRVPCRR